MEKVQNNNPVQDYLRGMLWAIGGKSVISGNVYEWQIDQAKEMALELKEKEIDNSSRISDDKNNQKRLLGKQYDAVIKGFKDELRRSGRINSDWRR